MDESSCQQLSVHWSQSDQSVLQSVSQLNADVRKLHTFDGQRHSQSGSHTGTNKAREVKGYQENTL